MVSSILNKKKTRAYGIPLVLLIFASIFLMICFAWQEYKTNKAKIFSQFEAESERIENAFINITEHTEFVMKIIIMQISAHPHDVNHINDVISKYSINKSLNNVLSWTVFNWLDQDFTVKVDSILGTKAQSGNWSNCDFLQLSKREPGVMHLGKPKFEFSSQRYVIPAGVGVVEGDSFLGSLTVGFDVVKLNSVLLEVIKSTDINFALVDENLDVILQSHKNNFDTSTDGEFKTFLKKSNVNFSDIDTVYNTNVFDGGAQHYLRRIPNYPFAIYLNYNGKIMSNSFWKEVTFRVIEVCVISFVALLLVMYIYKRENILRNQAEASSKIALNALQAKTDFLAYTAHELRSPLGYIITSSELISKKSFGNINDKYLEYIGNIKLAAAELIDFINDLLNEMRIEDGAFQVAFSSVNVESLLKRSMQLNLMNYNHKTVINLNIAKNLPNLISDGRRLLQVFDNLISNAIKYSLEGSLLEINAKIYKRKFYVIFKDQGCGMSKEEVKICLSKYGVIKKKENKSSSIGLGLPLVKQLLDALGAKFIIESKLGEGTKITIIFPAKLIDKGSM